MSVKSRLEAWSPLEWFRIHMEDCSFILFYIIKHLIKIIPEDHALPYTRKTDSGRGLKVQELIDFLQQEVENRERAMHFIKVGTINKDSQPTHQHRYKPLSYTIILNYIQL